MNNYEDRDKEGNEVDKLKNDAAASNSVDKESDVAKENEADNNIKKGSGIFTADGEELPYIEGGYDIIEPGGSLGDDDFVSN